MTDGIQIQFGVYDSSVFVENTRYVYRPWVLKHVTEISTSLTSSTNVVGVPNYHASRSQIFDMSGVVRTFKIDGVRLESEEDISNWDFVHTEKNFLNGNIYIGLSWLESKMQVALKGYVFRIIPVDSDSNGYLEGTFNVALTGVSVTFDNQNPQLLHYSLQLTERRAIGNAVY